MTETPPWPLDHPIPVAGAIIRDGDAVLLVRPKEETTHWLVSGFLEAFESAEEAAIRETREEVGLDVAVDRVVGSYSCRTIDKNMVFIVCLTHPVGGALILGDEIAEAHWFRLDELPDWPADSPAALAMADLLRVR